MLCIIAGYTIPDGQRHGVSRCVRRVAAAETGRLVGTRGRERGTKNRLNAE